MDLSLLSTLKNKLLTTTKFSEVANYFLTHFGENREFMGLGQRVQDPMLEAIVGQIAAQLFQGKATVQGLLLTRLAEQGFVHGACFIGGHISTVLYFEDVGKGLVVIAPMDGNCHYARFTGRPLPPRPTPSVN